MRSWDKAGRTEASLTQGKRGPRCACLDLLGMQMKAVCKLYCTVNGKECCDYEHHRLPSEFSHHHTAAGLPCGRYGSAVTGRERPDWKEPVVRSCGPHSRATSANALPWGRASPGLGGCVCPGLAGDRYKWEATPRMLRVPVTIVAVDRLWGVSMSFRTSRRAGLWSLVCTCLHERFLEM